MQLFHIAAAVDVVFGDSNLVADAGLVPVMALAEQVGLPGLVAEHVAITSAANGAGANPAAKVMLLLAGMVAGADSIDDVDRLRHAGNGVVFDEIWAPSTLGTFLRAFTHGHVQQLNAVLQQAVIALAERAPLLPGGDEVVFVIAPPLFTQRVLLIGADGHPFAALVGAAIGDVETFTPQRNLAG